jgi:hypothetical protein
VSHRMLALPLLVAAVVGLSSCSSQQSGSPTAEASPTTATSAPSSTAGADPLASVDPCSLVTASELSGNGLQPGNTVTAPGGRACRWERPDDGATIDGYVLQVVIYDTAGIDQLNTQGGTVSDYSVGKYHGKLFQDTAGNNCVVSLGTSDTSRVDIYVNSRLGLDTGCTVVKGVAPAIVSHFPGGS